MSQGWSWTLLTAWIDWEFELYECSSGLFTYILQGEDYECGLEKYKFKGHLLHAPSLSELLGLNFLEKAGEFLPNSCATARPNSNIYSGDIPVEEEVVEGEGEETTDLEETTEPSEATGLNTNTAQWW